MKRTALALILGVILLVTLGLQTANVATANFVVYMPYIIINSDGTVTPETEFINQTGNVYTLTGNLTQKYAIKIQCSNIIFDGAGYIINGTATTYAGFSNVGISLENVKNVTVKNVTVSGFWDAHLLLQDCVNCSVFRIKAGYFRVVNSRFNTISESNLPLLMRSSNSNMIFRNNISGSLDISGCNSNTFFENNFACHYYFIGNEAILWDNGSVGNYWSDYLTRYPNATEIDNTGIGDTPYVMINSLQKKPNATDNYPLMSPFIVSSSPEPQQEEPFSTLLAATVSATALIVVAGLLVYFKKRNAIRKK